MDIEIQKIALNAPENLIPRHAAIGNGPSLALSEVSAIRHHLGLGVIASHLVKEEIQNGQIIPINTSKPKIINQISIVNLQDKIPTLSEKVFQHFLIDQIDLMEI